MKIAHVEFDVEIPVDATDDEIEEWLRYEFRDNGTMRACELSQYHAKPISRTFTWERWWEPEE